MRKGSAPVIIIFAAALLLIGGASVFVVQTKFFSKDETPSTKPVAKASAKLEASASPLSTNDEMANWKTFTNKDLGFEIKYPNGAVFEEGELTGDDINESFLKNADRMYHVEIKLNDDEKIYIAISSNVHNENLPIDPKVNSEILAKTLVEQSFSDPTRKEIVFGGRKAYEIETVNKSFDIYYISAYGRTIPPLNS